jgi:hypothetical protein
MEIGAIMNAMRDPAGVPAPPALFQFLMVLTWTLHIAFVFLTLGAASLSIYAFYRDAADQYWRQLSMAMTKVAKVGVSLLIVLGVAPLLFTQVIYDPQWYASNVISGGWVILFIFTLTVAYCLWFVFYWSNHEQAKRRAGVYAVVALGLFLLDGLIMHALAYQAINPARWMDWYAPGGVVDTSGSHLHAIEWSRYLFLISLSAPTVGVYLIAYAEYFSVRSEKAGGYLEFARDLGLSIARPGLLVSIALFVWWQCAHPTATGLRSEPIGWMVPLGLLSLYGFLKGDTGVARAKLLLPFGLSVLAVLSIWREVIRIAYLSPLGYSITTYKVNTDWPSMGLFAATFVGVGGLVGGYYLTLIYRAGRTDGVYAADRQVARLGSAAVGVLALWIAMFFAYGVAIYVSQLLAAR